MKYRSISTLKIVFYVLIAVFVLVLFSFIFTSFETTMRVFFPIVGVLALIFLVLGIILVSLTIKLNIKGKLKVFLILTGAGAAGILVGSVLHNLVYALFILLFGEGFWAGNGIPDEPFYFISSIIVCPLLFLVGVAGSVVMFFKRKV